MKNPQLKRAYTTDEYTPKMISELAKCQKDPIYFMKSYIKIQHPVRGTIPFSLYEFQERFVHHMQNNRFTITLQPRQCGKCVRSTTAINTIKKPAGFRKFLLKYLDRKTYDNLFQNLS